MQSFGGASATRKLLAVALLAVLTLVLAMPASALTGSGDSEVQATLCRDTDISDLAVELPKDGKESTDGIIVVKAAASNLSEAKIYVQDALRSTVTLGEAAVGFEKSLVLADGSQTIKVVGYDLCHREFRTVSRDVTVRLPKPVQAAARSGRVVSETPVVYYDTAPTPPASSKPSVPTQGAVAEKTPISPATEPARPIVGRIFDWLEMGATFANFGNILRALLAVIGVYLALSGHVTWRRLERYIHEKRFAGPVKGKKKTARQRTQAGHGQLYLRIAGVILLLVLFVV
jgi:hypothetical protein